MTRVLHVTVTLASPGVLLRWTVRAGWWTTPGETVTRDVRAQVSNHRHVSLLLKYLTMQLMNVTRATSQFKKVNV